MRTQADQQRETSRAQQSQRHDSAEADVRESNGDEICRQDDADQAIAECPDRTRLEQ